MSVLSGLAALNGLIDQQGGGAKNNWFKLKDGESAKIWFLQELDEEHEFYNPEFGTALIIVEHSAPHNYMAKAQCTADTGACWACEQVPLDKKWKSRGRLYVNVAVESGSEKTVALLSQGLSGKGIVQTLVQYASEAGTVMDDAFRIKRTGADMNNTSYTLIPVPRSSGEDPKDYELYDLTKIVPVKPYDEQAAFYNKPVGDKQDESTEKAAAPDPERAALDW